MSPLSLAALPFAEAGAWSHLSRARPALRRVLAFPVLPLALLPPAMLYRTGTLEPGVLPFALSRGGWAGAAGLFFLIEVATLLAMAALIRAVARSSRLSLQQEDPFLIAALAPVPLWLASLGLLSPNLVLTATLAAFALGFACRAVYHGVTVLGRVREPVTAAWIAQIAVGGALVPWVLLLAVALLAR